MMNSTIFKNRAVKYSVIVFVWLTVWEIVSLFVNNSILIVGPIEVFLKLIINLSDVEFYKSILGSLLKISFGYVIGALFGGVLAILAWKNKIIGDFFEPIFVFMKAAPVASFVVLFLIWWNSEVLSIAICICIVAPQIYTNMLAGLNSTDSKLLEMASVFGLSGIDKIHYIYRPAVYDHIESAVKISAAMAWKAGVAAEVIGTPDNSIGNKLYMSKIYLDTAGVLSWTVVIIVLSIICEKLLLKILKIYGKYEFKCRGIINKKHETVNEISLDNICKKYGENSVIDHFGAILKKGKRYLYDWPSGAGKTTLLKIIARIENQDAGNISPKDYSVSMLFQEDRLIEGFSAIKNVELITGNEEKAKEILLKLLSEEDIVKPIEELSGGQRRRVAIARACAKNSDVVIFDEPYEGLDAKTKDKVESVIIDHTSNKIVLIASHVKVSIPSES